VRTATGKLQVRGQGTLLWDLGAGHAHSFALESDVELLASLEAAFADEQGGEHSAEAEVELLMELAWKMQ
jgi:hypothetical protein